MPPHTAPTRHNAWCRARLTLESVKRRFPLALVAAWAGFTAQSGAVLNGAVVGCFSGKRYQPEGVDIYVFDAQESSAIISLIKEVDAHPEPDGDPRDPVAVKRWTDRYDRLGELVKKSSRLAHTKSGKGGLFRLEVRGSVDSVVVVGYAESVDGPADYAHAQVKIGRPTVTVQLNFDPGSCGQ